jgi:hypothetical protein
MKNEILTAFALSVAALAVCVCCFWLANRPRTLIDERNVLVTQQGHFLTVTDRAGRNAYIFRYRHARKQEAAQNTEKQPYRAVDVPTLKIDIDSDGKTLILTDADGTVFTLRKKMLF